MLNAPLALALSLLLSFPLFFLFAPRFLPPRHIPISLPDELDDIALFRRASLAEPPLRFTYPGVGRPKIAFLFLTNTDLHLAPLWEHFFRGNDGLYTIYVHADPSSSVTPPGGVFSRLRFISAKETHRASSTLISAARRLLATAILHDPSNSYFALLSQHCIPLHSFTYIYTTLFLKPPPQPPPPPSTTYPSFIEISSDQPVLWDRYIARGINAMLPEVPFDRFKSGSQFFVLTRQHALVVIRDRRLWRKFKLPCLNPDSCYPEEHYFPTLLSMEDPDRCTHYTLTRVNWTGSVGGHPHTYGPEEVSPRLIHELRSSNSSHSFLFARKFSQDCLQPLLDMAQEIIFRD